MSKAWLAAVIVLVALSFAVGSVLGAVLMAKKDGTALGTEPQNAEISIHDAHPRLTWIRTKHGFETAWIKAKPSGVDITLFLRRSDIDQIVSRVQRGPCDDTCPKEEE